MSYIKAGTDASGNDIKLFYQDLGTGSQTVVLIHRLAIKPRNVGLSIS